jgi:hypothetical protein
MVRLEILRSSGKQGMLRGVNCKEWQDITSGVTWCCAVLMWLQGVTWLVRVALAPAR